MKFEPRTPDHDVNVTQEHPLKNAVSLALGVIAVFTILALLLVATADVVVGLVPIRLESRVFSAWQPDELFDDDQDAAVPVGALLDSLVELWPEAKYEFRVAVTDAEAPNAVALPGGLIVVTTGLLSVVDSENELAFVMAHELGHYRNRDHLRQMGRSAALEFVFGLIGGHGNFGSIWGDLTTRGFSREQEREADRFGLALSYRKYGHVGDTSRFFQRLRASSGLEGYLSTHPHPDERIAALHRQAQEAGWPSAGAITEWPH